MHGIECRVVIQTIYSTVKIVLKIAKPFLLKLFDRLTALSRSVDAVDLEIHLETPIANIGENIICCACCCITSSSLYFDSWFTKIILTKTVFLSGRLFKTFCRVTFPFYSWWRLTHGKGSIGSKGVFCKLTKVD